ncbi:MAG: dockerin type I repeat-containing protein [Acutalibacteraceae bacterium]|nr:dockerin type I repeat-containing protein [Acutalibacteraceae bacterium]
MCYNGSESEWNNITIGYNNEVIENINIYFSPAPTNTGDINNDGEISITDVISVLKYVISSIDLTDKQLANADLNKDSEVTVIDAILLQKMILEMV